MMGSLSCVYEMTMDDCPIEAYHILRETDGHYNVGEYDSSGSYDDIFRMCHDQSARRTWALDAQLRLSQDVVASVRKIHYGLKFLYFDFENFVTSFMGVSRSELINANIDSENVRVLLERSRRENFPNSNRQASQFALAVNFFARWRLIAGTDCHE